MSAIPQYLGLAFLAAPVLLGLVLVVLYRQHRRIARNLATAPAGWVPVSARVVDERVRHVATGGAGTNTVFLRCPVLRFRTVDGREVTAPSLVEASYLPRPGATVVAYYDPADPNRARVGPESIPRSNAVARRVGWTVMAVLYVPFAGLFGLVGYLMLGS